MSPKIYPILFYSYTMGSSLGYLISLHNGFYSYSYGYTYSQVYDPSAPADHKRSSYDNSTFVFENDYREIMNSLSNHDKNLKYSLRFRVDHHKLDLSFYPYIGKNIFPIIIKLDKQLLNFILKRNKYLYQHNKIKFTNRYTEMISKCENDQFWYDDLELLEMYDAKKKDFLIIDILKLYNHDKSEYHKLCDFIEENPRITICNDIDNIKNIIEFNKFI